MIKYPLNVTINTNIFEATHFNFNENSTQDLLLKKINEGKVNLVISDIVIKEVQRHIEAKANKVCGTAKKPEMKY